MSYTECIEYAGAKIIEYKEFGSYQGDWWAKVEYNGKVGWVTEYFGSCSGCDAFEADAFEAEFGFSDNHYEDEKNCIGYHSYYDLKEGCERCKELKNRMADFGRGYLDNILSQEEAEKEAVKNLDWDMDAEEMLGFIKSNPICVSH